MIGWIRHEFFRYFMNCGWNSFLINELSKAHHRAVSQQGYRLGGGGYKTGYNYLFFSFIHYGRISQILNMDTWTRRLLRCRIPHSSVRHFSWMPSKDKNEIPSVGKRAGNEKFSPEDNCTLILSWSYLKQIWKKKKRRHGVSLALAWRQRALAVETKRLCRQSVHFNKSLSIGAICACYVFYVFYILPEIVNGKKNWKDVALCCNVLVTGG